MVKRIRIFGVWGQNKYPHFICYIIVLHHKIFHAEKENAPYLTLVHGAGGSSSIWHKQIRTFKEHFNVLVIDLRGHGMSKFSLKSDHIEKYSFEFIANDVIKVLDHLKIEKTHFAGISLGTIIMRQISEMRPDLVDSMVMGGAIIEFNFRSKLLIHFGNLFKYVLPYMILYKLFAFIIMPRDKHKESRNLFIEEAKKVYQKEFLKWFRLTWGINKLLTIFRTTDSGKPTLYIMGEEDYMFLPAVKYLISKHEKSSLLVIPNCGHVVNVEAPVVFNNAVIDFINSKKD